MVGSVPSCTTCRPYWVAPAVGAGGKVVSASAGDKIVEDAATAYPNVRACVKE